MVYRQGELNSARIDREWPHQVALPAETVRLRYYDFHNYCRGLSVSADTSRFASLMSSGSSTVFRSASCRCLS
jgi:hypothetical protein